MVAGEIHKECNKHIQILKIIVQQKLMTAQTSKQSEHTGVWFWFGDFVFSFLSFHFEYTKTDNMQIVNNAHVIVIPIPAYI